MKPTKQGCSLDLARVKARLTRSYNRGEISQEQLTSLLHKTEKLNTDINQILEGSVVGGENVGGKVSTQG